MTDTYIKDDVLNISVPKKLVSNKLVQKLMLLIRFDELTKNSALSETQAYELAEDIQTKWWEENKDWFLKDIQQ